jgi:hypothetical protein
MHLHSSSLILCLFFFLEGCVAQDPQCTEVGTAFCASDSLKSNIILRCTQSSGSTPQPGNCNDKLVSTPSLNKLYSINDWIVFQMCLHMEPKFRLTVGKAHLQLVMLNAPLIALPWLLQTERRSSLWRVFESFRLCSADSFGHVGL